MVTNPLGLGINWDQKRMTTEADTCREYVVPICLGGGGSLFCCLKTLAFSLQPLALVSRVSGQLRNCVNQLQSLLYSFTIQGN